MSSRKTTTGTPVARSRCATTGSTWAHHGMSTGNGPTFPAHTPPYVTTAVTVRPIRPV